MICPPLVPQTVLRGQLQEERVTGVASGWSTEEMLEKTKEYEWRGVLDKGNASGEVPEGREMA